MHYRLFIYRSDSRDMGCSVDIDGHTEEMWKAVKFKVIGTLFR